MPFLYPWANRLNDAKFLQAKAPTAWWRDEHGLPLHGLLLKSDRWRSVPEQSRPTEHVAVLDFDDSVPGFEFYPYVHQIEMVHRLLAHADGVRVQIETWVHNTGEGQMPLAFGYHPYLATGTQQRSQLRVSLPANLCFETDPHLLPTGKLLPVAELWPAHLDLNLDGVDFDHGFTELLVPDGSENPEFVLNAPDARLAVRYGSAYKVAVVYAPPGPGEFVCFEPMLGPTNAWPLTEQGLWPSMPVLEPGGSFVARFVISAGNPD